jgi:ABC-type transport system involved in cytochrome c biogenesis permease subunit
MTSEYRWSSEGWATRGSPADQGGPPHHRPVAGSTRYNKDVSLPCMTETSVMWLRVAAALYSLGLIDAVFVLTRQRETFFRTALGAFGLGGLFHLVSIVEQGMVAQQFPVEDIYQRLSLCAFLITVSFLFAYWKYRTGSLSVFIFPLVFVIALVAALGKNVAVWSSPALKNTWLITHIVFILLGYAALLFTAVAAALYLYQERQLKLKKTGGLSFRLPSLGVLDDLVSSSLSLGFVFITIGIIIGTVWASVEYGTKWIGDPRIGISFITWGIYLVLVFFRTSAGWRGRKAAVLAITALFLSVITWVTHGGILVQ